MRHVFRGMVPPAVPLVMGRGTPRLPVILHRHGMRAAFRPKQEKQHCSAHF